MTIRREIIWEDATAPNSDVLKKEREMIIGLRANDPTIGYNGTPKFRPVDEQDAQLRPGNLPLPPRRRAC